MTTLGPYECHNAYRALHTGPTGVEWMAFVAACNERPRHPQAGDGAARSPRAVAASPSQCAPSPSIVDGGVR